MTKILTRLCLTVALAMAGALHATARADDEFGIMVMAHGGDANWNREVEAMLAPLRRDHRLEIAFGMADPATMQDAVRKLEGGGARRIAVVRLFISGESWYERTEQILGLRPGAQVMQRTADHAGHANHAAPHGNHDMPLWRIETRASFALSSQGLADAPEMGAVLADRARALSRDPRQESVLVLAHGAEDDAENDRWRARIGARAETVRQMMPFRRVQAETLREDWPDKRATAEARIRGFVEQAAQEGGQAIVIPFRVAGFGPYAKVLDGLSYVSDGKGLIPSPQIEQWVRRQIEELRAGAFRTPLSTQNASAGE
jgi:sirohydrochlorin cobaltochelatase